jgi:type III secretory pathway component EscV
MATLIEYEISRDQTERDVVQLHVWVRRELWRRVRRQCAREDRKLRAFVAEALAERLAEHRPNPRRR